MGKRSQRKRPGPDSMKKIIGVWDSVIAFIRAQKRMEERKRIGRSPEVANMKPYRPEILEFLIRSIGGTDPNFVTEKIITETDMNEHHDRVLFPAAKIKNMFLSDEEEDLLRERQKMKVYLVEPSLTNMSIVKLGKWKMGQNIMYVLNSGWLPITQRKENSLRKGTKVQLWSFRRQGFLGFVLTRVGF